MGIGPGDCPPFDRMHEASAAVAGGSIDAVDRILAGEVEHAFHPGGGLHHAMAGRASGFCIYNDVALAVARARDAGHRVLYVDLDVHHGDGTQALFWDDPQVLTLSIHESGQTLFPGSGFVDERGGRRAEGTVVNVPLTAATAATASWVPVVERDRARAGRGIPADVPGQPARLRQPRLRPARAPAPDHPRLPLATQLLDDIAHQWAGGRWLATGGGGYDAYRVVPRSWSLVWLAQAHREPAGGAMRGGARGGRRGDRFGQSPPPTLFLDPADLVGPGAGRPDSRHNAKTVERALARRSRT